MNADKYLALGFNQLKNNKALINGAEVDCVLDMVQYAKQREYGFDENFVVPIMVLTCKVPSLKTILGKTLEINSESWRIQSVRVGAVTSIINLISTQQT